MLRVRNVNDVTDFVGPDDPDDYPATVAELLAAGTSAAQRSGNTAMLSDVDVRNRPMLDAMRRAGHQPDRRPWHVWACRTTIPDLISPD